MPPNNKLWVPQPASQLYGAGGSHPETVRDRMVRQFGESTVVRAELSVCLDIMMLSGLIKPNEFIDIMQRKCQRIDDERRIAAGMD